MFGCSNIENGMENGKIYKSLTDIRVKELGDRTLLGLKVLSNGRLH
jgi:hypothetical protein